MRLIGETLELLVAGLRVLALSVVTNVCRPDRLATVDGHDVVAAARVAEPKMRKIVWEMLHDFARSADAPQSVAAGLDGSRAGGRASQIGV